MSSFSEKAIKFFSKLSAPDDLPEGISVYNPYQKKEVIEIVKKFFNKFYNDNNKRIFLIGINPGRFGAGTTGIGFTDPVALREFCKIKNDMGTVRELSSRFIYTLIEKFGGAEKFYSKFYLSAMYPIAVIKENKNYNYYDEKILLNSLMPHIKDSIKRQIEFGADKRKAVCIGKKNSEYFKLLNDDLNYFEKVEIVNHPRWVMQYRLKSIDKYVDEYIKALS